MSENTLEELRVRGIANHLFKSYFKYSPVSTKVNGICSDSQSLKWGSILGPTLYSLFINKRKSAGIKGHYTIFADDTSLFWSAKTEIKLEKTVNRDLLRLNTWIDGNRLSLNTLITNYVIFRTRNKPIISSTIELNGIQLNKVNYTITATPSPHWEVPQWLVW